MTIEFWTDVAFFSAAIAFYEGAQAAVRWFRRRRQPPEVPISILRKLVEELLGRVAALEYYKETHNAWHGAERH